MVDWEKKAKMLEEKVLFLEETLQTIKKMQQSVEISQYISKQQNILKIFSLINNISDNTEFDISQLEENIKKCENEKNIIDYAVEVNHNRSNNIINQYSVDSQYFNFELESGIIKRYENDVIVKELSPCIGKGVRITGYSGNTTGTVIIPSEIEGYPVVSIGSHVFENTQISEIILPNNLCSILDSAFKNCSKLRDIQFPENLTYIGEQCFYSSGLKSVIIPNKIQEISSFSFAHCRSLINVKLGENVKIVGNGSFMNCPILEITFPNSVEELKGNCFSSTKITNITFPNTIKRINPTAFANITFGRSNPQKLLTNENNKFLNCYFLGKDTVIESEKSFEINGFCGVRMIYCLPGSKIEKYAKDNFIITKLIDEDHEY